MAYGGASENAEMLRSTVRRSLDGSGRSRRTEVVYWWFATALASIVVSFAVSTAFPWKAGIIIDDVIRAMFLVPVFALFARRLHDQGRSGWWAVLLPASIIFSLPDTIRSVAGDPSTLLMQEETGAHALRWIAVFASVGTLILMLLPGTIGPNRYGADPRESGDPAPA